jgi:hypothetical protein
MLIGAKEVALWVNDFLLTQYGFVRIEGFSYTQVMVFFTLSLFVLPNLVPSSFGQTRQYSTRNHSNLVHVHSRTAYYNNSFLPSTVRLWNELPANIKSNVMFVSSLL